MLLVLNLCLYSILLWIANSGNQKSNPFYDAQNRLDVLAIVFSFCLVGILIALMYALPIVMLLCLSMLIVVKYQDKQNEMKYYASVYKDSKTLSKTTLK